MRLDALGNIAQIVIAAAAAVALVGALAQVLTARSATRTGRVYEYQDRINTVEKLAEWQDWSNYWKRHDYAAFKFQPREKQLEWYALANLMEEIAMLYDRKLLDREVASEVLGLYAELLWDVSQPFIEGVRTERNDRWVYDYWEQMQRRTKVERKRIKRRLVRRRARREILLLRPSGKTPRAPAVRRPDA
jgi:hypothetical protein